MKAFRFRLYPTKEQAVLINKTIGCSRFVYNHFLDKWNTVYNTTGKGLSYHKCATHLPILKKEFEWLKEVAIKGDWIVLTGDNHLRTNPANKKIFDEYKLTTFIFGGKFVNNNGWDQTWKLVKVWPKIIELSFAG